MIAALDGEGVPELADHLAECPECAEERRRVAAVDRVLRAAPSIEPPIDLALRIERRIAQARNGRAAWRRTVTGIALVSAGVATTALAATTLALVVRPRPGAIDVLGPLVAAASGLAGAAARGPLGALVLAALAAGLGVAWFTVLFAPRLAARSDRS